jgi:hypothetical protein
MPKVKGMPDHFMCKDCRVIKHNDDYYKDKSSYRGLSDRCKPCSKKNAGFRRKQNWRKYLDRQMEITQELKKEVYDNLGRSCACCGETEPEFLVVDHVKGNGAQHRKDTKALGGQAIYRAIKKEGFPKDSYQILCHNCNWSKGTGPEGMCVHKRGNQI